MIISIYYIIYIILRQWKGINHNTNEDYPLSIIKDFHLPLSISQSLPSLFRSLKIATWKDERLDYLDIPKGLIEVLQTNGFTIEMILEYGPSQIAEKLGIDDYVAQIIFNETTIAINSFS
jgi:hypothetical protein